MATDDLQKSQDLGKEQSQQISAPMNDYDPDNKSETETKSLSSIKSNGSNPDLRYTYTHFYYFFLHFFLLLRKLILFVNNLAKLFFNFYVFFSFKYLHPLMFCP